MCFQSDTDKGRASDYVFFLGAVLSVDDNPRHLLTQLSVANFQKFILQTLCFVDVPGAIKPSWIELFVLFRNPCVWEYVHAWLTWLFTSARCHDDERTNKHVVRSLTHVL